MQLDALGPAAVLESEYFPAAHAPVHWLVVDPPAPYRPAAQGEQTPSAEPYLPAAQGLHEGAPNVEVWPIGQLEQLHAPAPEYFPAGQ